MLALGLSQQCGAQIELANGIDFVYPLLLNKYNANSYYNQVGGGLHFGISYKPEETQFFPTLNLAFGASKLPVVQFGNNVATISMNYFNAMLNGNIIIPLNNNNSIFLLEGIGFSNFKHKLPSVSGENGGAMNIHLDSTGNIDKFFPSVGAGVEYVFGEAVNRSLYLCFGIYCQYVILFPDRNSYYLEVRDPKRGYYNVMGAITGDIVFPSVYLSLHYLIDKKFMFWKKKDSRFL